MNDKPHALPPEKIAELKALYPQIAQQYVELRRLKALGEDVAEATANVDAVKKKLDALLAEYGPEGVKKAESAYRAIPR